QVVTSTLAVLKLNTSSNLVGDHRGGARDARAMAPRMDLARSVFRKDQRSPRPADRAGRGGGPFAGGSGGAGQTTTFTGATPLGHPPFSLCIFDPSAGASARTRPDDASQGRRKGAGRVEPHWVILPSLRLPLTAPCKERARFPCGKIL